MMNPYIAQTMLEHNRDEIARSRGYRSWKHLLRDYHLRPRR
ncbi:hypothetical protein BH23CHL1_BH23CHL1_15020 [soil metagenome]